MGDGMVEAAAAAAGAAPQPWAQSSAAAMPTVPLTLLSRCPVEPSVHLECLVTDNWSRPSVACSR